MSLTIVLALSLGVRALSTGPEVSHRRALGRGLELGTLSVGAMLGGALLGRAVNAGPFRGLLVFTALSYVGGQLLLESVRPPEEQELPSHRSVLRGVGMDALLMGLSLPCLPVHLRGTVGAVGVSSTLMGTLGALLPREVSDRILPWVSALGGLALTCIGMRALLSTLP